MTGNPYMDIAGAAIGLFGAKSAKKAARKQAEATMYAARKQSQTMKDIAAPWQDAGKRGLSRLQSLIANVYAPEIDKEDPYLAAEHAGNLTDIERQAKKAGGGATRFWSGTGNVGKARGEQLLVDQSALEAKNTENLNYGKAQTEFKTNARQRLMAALGLQVNAGQTAIGPLMNAASAEAGGATNAAAIEAGGATDFWGELGSTFGDIEGGIESRKFNKKWLELLADAYKDKDTDKTTLAGNKRWFRSD